MKNNKRRYIPPFHEILKDEIEDQREGKKVKSRRKKRRRRKKKKRIIQIRMAQKRGVKNRR